MGSKVWLIFGLLALAMVAECISFDDATVGVVHLGHDSDSWMLDSLADDEISRRHLAQQRYISYGALRANSVPCNRRGNSYYNCANRQQVNPYNRGCSRITHCHRYTG